MKAKVEFRDKRSGEVVILDSLLKGNKQNLDSLLLFLKLGGCDSKFASARVL